MLYLLILKEFQKEKLSEKLKTDLYNEYLETRKSKYEQPPRLAVPDNMIVKTFDTKLDNIYHL